MEYRAFIQWKSPMGMVHKTFIHLLFANELHVNMEHKAPWFEFEDGLPRHDGMPGVD